MKFKRGQASTEYLTIISFIIFVLIAIMAIALFYVSSIQTSIKSQQIENCANKIVSSAESVFYYGEPSRATITCYLPEGITEILIQENAIFISAESPGGISKRGFYSNVPISGDLEAFSGSRKIRIQAEENGIVISLT